MKPVRDPGWSWTSQRYGKTLELSNGEARTADWRDHRVGPTAVAHTRINEWSFERQLSADAPGDAMRKLGHILGAAE